MSIIGPKGVRKDHKRVRNVIYLLSGNRKVGVGVRREDIEYMVKKTSNITSLLYNKPCVCGSLLHPNTKDPMCFLNDQYTDCYNN